MEAVVMHEYEKQQEDELDLKVGEVIQNIVQVGDEWCEGTLRGVRGMFPSNYVTAPPPKVPVPPPVDPVQLRRDSNKNKVRRAKGHRPEPKRFIQMKEKAEKPWSAKRETVAEAMEEDKKTQELYRKFQSILNKLTPQKFQSLAEQALQLDINNEERLRGVIDKIYTKALEEPIYRIAYANLCKVLSPVKVEWTMPDGKVKSANFRRVLLSKCQQEFEKDKRDDEDREKMLKAIEEAESAEKKKELEEELAAVENKSRQRSLGNIHFIGELFKVKMLSETVMHECMIRLLRYSSDAETLECFARLITTTGKDLDHAQAKERIDRYFIRIAEIIEKGKIPARIKFMLQDVQDLRRNKWVVRFQQDNTLKTIDQIHAEARMEQERAKVREGKDDDWTKVERERDKKPIKVDASRIRGLMRRERTKEPTLGPPPATLRPAWGKGAGSSTASASSQETSKASKHSKPLRQIIHVHVKKRAEREKGPSGRGSGSAPKRAQPVPDAMDEDTLSRKTATTVDELSQNKDIKVVEVILEEEEGWLREGASGKEGLFPSEIIPDDEPHSSTQKLVTLQDEFHSNYRIRVEEAERKIQNVLKAQRSSQQQQRKTRENIQQAVKQVEEAKAQADIAEKRAIQAVTQAEEAERRAQQAQRTCEEVQRLVDERAQSAEAQAEQAAIQVVEAERRAQEAQRTCEEVQRREQVREAETQEAIHQAVRRAEEAETRAREAERRAANSEEECQTLRQRLTDLELSVQRILQRIPSDQPLWAVSRDEIQMTEEEIGRGGWGSINVAIYHGRRVAAKTLHHQIISQHNLRLFMREMNMAARVQHSNLVRFIGATIEGEPIILSELMETSLRSLLAAGPLPYNQIVSISLDVARGLNYLHQMQPDPVIHRDVSSANVLLERSPQTVWKAKVSDFGSANFMSHAVTAGPGNPLYAPPEAYNPYQQSPKMDVFSFGILLIETCTREMPPVEEREQLITQIRWPAMVTLVRSCLREESAQRPTMSAVLGQLVPLAAN